MKLNQNQLNGYFNKKQLHHFYWINSEDGFLLQDALKKIKKLTVTNGYTDKIVFHIDNNVDWADINNAIKTPSLFASNQIIELHFVNKITAAEQQELIKIAEYINNYTHTICMIIYPFRVDSKTLKTKWMAALDNYGVVITLWPLSHAEYPKWLRGQAQKYNMQFEDFSLFCEKTMGNTNVAMQTLYKLKLQNINRVSNQLLLDTLAEHACYTTFDLIDSYLQGDTILCFRIIKILKLNNEIPLLIIWSLRKELILLAEILENAKNKSISAQQELQNHKLWQTKVNILSKALHKFNLNIIYTSLHKIACIENLIKTENNPVYIWQQLEALLLIANNTVLFYED